MARHLPQGSTPHTPFFGTKPSSEPGKHKNWTGSSEDTGHWPLVSEHTVVPLGLEPERLFSKKLETEWIDCLPKGEMSWYISLPVELFLVPTSVSPSKQFKELPEFIASVCSNFDKNTLCHAERYPTSPNYLKEPPCQLRSWILSLLPVSRDGFWALASS
jgi:hypothetical protein